MRRRNSQIIDIFRTDDIKEFKKVKKHIITSCLLTRAPSGRAHSERYSQDRNGCKSDYVMVARAVDMHKIKSIIQTVNKCFTQEVTI